MLMLIGVGYSIPMAMAQFYLIALFDGWNTYSFRWGAPTDV